MLGLLARLRTNHGAARCSRKEFVRTKTELKLIAPVAIIELSRRPRMAYKMPAASFHADRIVDEGDGQAFSPFFPKEPGPKTILEKFRFRRPTVLAKVDAGSGTTA